MQGFPLIPRAEMRLWQAGRGGDLILKDEWRPNLRSLFFLPPPNPACPYPALLPRIPTPLLCPPRLHLYMHAKSPRLLPHLGVGSRGLSHAIRYSAIRYGAISVAVR